MTGHRPSVAGRGRCTLSAIHGSSRVAIKVAASVLYLKPLNHWLVTADQPVALKTDNEYNLKMNDNWPESVGASIDYRVARHLAVRDFSTKLATVCKCSANSEQGEWARNFLIESHGINEITVAGLAWHC